MLDSCRFSALIAQELNLAPSQVKAILLGEHGDSMVPIWSSASVNGFLLTGLPNMNTAMQGKLFERTRGSGAEVISRKGGAGWAVGISIREVIHSILLDKKCILPVSTSQQGAYGIRDVCLSVPTVLGRTGAIEQIEIGLWPREKLGLQNSARALQETFSKLK